MKNTTNTLSINRLQYPLSVSSVSDIGGFIGHRIELNRENYIKKFPIEEYIEFIEKKEHTEWSWTKAEQHGKWIESAFLSAIQSGDEELLKKAENIFLRMIKSQEDEGYVGATAKIVRSPEKPLRGMDAYELYFVLHALITVYEESGKEQALESAIKLADYFEKYIGPGKAEFWPSELKYPNNKKKELKGQSAIAGHSVHYSWEGSLLIDPMLRLYLVTQDEKYLEWSKWVVSNIDKWSGWNAFSNLEKVADGTMGVHELQPYVHSHTFQMNFLGILRLYQITGDKSLLRKVEGAWNDIASRQMYITGGVSVAEHYEHGYIKPLSGNVVETCATMSWMQVTQYLLELTGDVKYADAIEKLLLNHVFAAQTANGDCNRYHTPPNGYKPAGYYHGPNCCTGSGHRLISLLPVFFYAQNQNKLYINQFVHSTAEFTINGEKVVINVETDFPESEKINIQISPEESVKMNLHVRIPGWCKEPVISLNREEVDNVISGSYLSIERNWQKGDVLEISFPQQLRWVKREHHQKYTMDRLPGGEMMYSGIPDPNPPYALMRGPVIYALDMVWRDDESDGEPIDIGKSILVNKNILPNTTVKPDKDLLGPTYELDILVHNKNEKIIMLPFANIGNWYKDVSNKPDKDSQKYAYAIWLQTLNK